MTNSGENADMSTGLSLNDVKQIMLGVLDGSVSRVEACRTVASHVTHPDRNMDSWALNGAQLIHRFDMVKQGRWTFHASDGRESVEPFMFTDEEVRKCIAEWMEEDVRRKDPFTRLTLMTKAPLVGATVSFTGGECTA